MAAGRHFSGLCTRLLIDLVAWRVGPDAVPAVLAAAGETRSPAALSSDSSWSSYRQVRRLLEAAAAHLGGPEELRALCDLPTIGAGTRPEVTAALHEYGSPADTFVASKAILGPAVDMEPRRTGPSSLQATMRLAEGLEPYPELCAFLTGLMPLSVRIFGLQTTCCEEISCRCRGDSDCVVTLAWDETEDSALALEHARFQARLAESRLEAVRATVESIVSTEDLDTVMGRIVEAASRTASAAGFVLEIGAPGGGTSLYSHDMDLDEAEVVVRRANAGDPDLLSVVVESRQRRYGRLIASHPEAALGFERPALANYARLAAAALDSAFALAEARRQADTSRALLELASSLAGLSTTPELTARIARTLTEVIDCDCAFVQLVDDGFYRVGAHHGFGPPEAAALTASEVPVADHLVREVTVRTADGDRPRSTAMLSALGLQALATAPISSNGELIGALVVGVRERKERITADSYLAERLTGLAGQAAVALRNGRLVEQMRHQSLHDPLTGLPNRALVLDRAEQMLARARRSRVPASVLFLDIDGFKDVNDTLGHGVGDYLLCAVADRLRATVRLSDTVGRLGGDEFVVLVEHRTAEAEAGEDGAEAVAERIIAAVSEPFRLPGRVRPLMVTTSIGIARGFGPAADLLRDADVALYAAKAAGKRCVRVFEPAMQDSVRCRARMAEDLSRAVNRDEFSLAYQPIFDLRAGTAVGVEALLRWNHPELGPVSPADFVPMLEEMGLIAEVGTKVVLEACLQGAEWHAQGWMVDISVNASVRELEDPSFAATVEAALQTSGFPATSLVVEVTETAATRDRNAVAGSLAAIRRLGVKVAIDDFGSGYSWLAYIKDFEIDAVKIDRSFVSGAASADGQALVRSIMNLAQALAVETVAEGIETAEQLQMLIREGCTRGQGYLLGRPVLASEFPRTVIPLGASL